MVTMSGLDAVVLVAEPLAGAAEAGLDLVDDEAGADLVGDGAQLLHELRRRHDEAALALDGLDDDAGHVVAVDLGAQHAAHVFDGVVRGVLAGRRAVRVAVARVVDAAHERLVVAAVVHGGVGEGHGEVGAAVEGALEGDDAGPARDLLGQLDRVLDGLGAGVGEHDLVDAARARSRAASRRARASGRAGRCSSARARTLAACSCTALTTLGWQWPVLTTAMPITKSSHLPPSVS